MLYIVCVQYIMYTLHSSTHVENCCNRQSISVIYVVICPFSHPEHQHEISSSVIIERRVPVIGRYGGVNRRRLFDSNLQWIQTANRNTHCCRGCWCAFSSSRFPGWHPSSTKHGALQSSSSTPPTGQPEELHPQQHSRRHRHLVLSVRPARGKDYQVGKLCFLKMYLIIWFINVDMRGLNVRAPATSSMIHLEEGNETSVYNLVDLRSSSSLVSLVPNHSACLLEGNGRLVSHISSSDEA